MHLDEGTTFNINQIFTWKQGFNPAKSAKLTLKCTIVVGLPNRGGGGGVIYVY